MELHPGTDAWLQGDRFGTVESVGRKLVRVRLDRSGRVRWFLPARLTRVYSLRATGVELRGEPITEQPAPELVAERERIARDGSGQ